MSAHALPPSWQRLWRATLLCAGLLWLTGCGFHLKSATPLPFHTLYTNVNLDTEFGARLHRLVVANSPETRFVAHRNEAEVILHVLSESERRRQVALDPDGRVEEYELTLTLDFELLDAQGHLLLAPTTLTSVREIPYNERVVQAKDSELERTFRDMRNSLIDQLLRRLSAPEVQAAYRNANAQVKVPLPDDTIEHGTAGDDRDRPFDRSQP